jgi:hypothetical protein
MYVTHDDILKAALLSLNIQGDKNFKRAQLISVETEVAATSLQEGKLKVELTGHFKLGERTEYFYFSREGYDAVKFLDIAIREAMGNRRY